MYKLRWLFYRKIPNFQITKARYSPNRCSNCKKGVDGRIVFSSNNPYEQKILSPCPHCNKEYIKELNINLDYKLYKIAKYISKLFWLLLDKLHLVRSSIEGRYDMFGDESCYIKSWIYNEETGKITYILKDRKWWQYIIIKTYNK